MNDRSTSTQLWREAVGKTSLEDNEHNEKTTFGKMSLKTTATVKDLYRVPENGKAELVNGELVIMAATGFLPGLARGEIYSSLRDYGFATQRGYGLPDNMGYLVNLPARQSVCV